MWLYHAGLELGRQGWRAQQSSAVEGFGVDPKNKQGLQAFVKGSDMIRFTF